jgi:hypothetical protein
MPISPKNQKIIWTQSAGRCAICKNPLLKKTSNDKLEFLGELAHIEGDKPAAKRYRSSQSEQERNDHKNIILLCPNDHLLVDRDEVEYTVEKLKKIKESHLIFISNSTKSELSNVTFAELQVIVSYLVSSNKDYATNDSLEHITPKEKIDKNKISEANASLITMGMTRVKQVKDYLNTNPDVNFSERLKTRLANYYNEEKAKESDPNVLFENMLDYMSESSSDFKKIASALSVLTYFFETCDIFEK